MIILSLSKVSFPESAGDNRDNCDDRLGAIVTIGAIVTRAEVKNPLFCPVHARWA